jgi:hypothetical protein
MYKQKFYKAQVLRNPKNKYWYKIIIEECPPCGRSEVHRERMYTDKPEDYNDRYEYHQYWCGCGW